MHTQTLTITLTSLLLGATTLATPVVLGPGPEAGWYASSYLEESCDGTTFQNFSGTAAGCFQVVNTEPYKTNSIDVGSTTGSFAFKFFEDEKCGGGGITDGGISHQVTTGQDSCVDTGSFDGAGPGSFYVDVIPTTGNTVRKIAPRTPEPDVDVDLTARSEQTADTDSIGGLGPVTLWNLTTYEDQSCNGKIIENFHGSGSEDCEAVGGLSAKAGSVNLEAVFATYSFGLFSDKVCKVGNTPQQPYMTDRQLCIGLGTSGLESFKVDFITGCCENTPKERATLESRD